MDETENIEPPQKPIIIRLLKAEALQTVILPSILLPLGIVGICYLSANLSFIAEGVAFVIWLVFLPMSILVGPILFLLIHCALPFGFKKRRATSLAACSLILVLITLFAVTAKEEYMIGKITLKNGYQCKIYAATCWEVSRPLCYEIRKDGTILVRKTYFDSDSGDGEYEFRAVYSDNDTIIGIIQISSDSEKLLAIYNVLNNESWPRLRYDEVSYDPKVIEKWTNIFMKLQKENPTIPVPILFKQE
ncbi:MAG: hypothetical protein KAS23_12390 [Anaerohalosphaera sp.]|nr:hypothetical protein [Anaerohalosphaera sp.]